MKKQYVAAAGLLAAVMLSSCGKAISKNEKMDVPDDDAIIPAVTTVKSSEDTSEEILEYEEQEITAEAVTYTEYSKSYEAENGVLSGTAETKDEREGYSGKGYVTSITSESDWEISFDLPAEQYYNITVTVASDEIVKNGLAVNGEKISEFTTKGSKGFETVSFNNVRLDKGAVTLTIVPENGTLDVDSVTVKASEDISKLSLSLVDAELSNSDADYNAKALYEYLIENFGSAVIVGQHDTAGTTTETDLIYRTTGRYPAIRFGDLANATDEDTTTIDAEIEIAKEWYENGGIVGYMWHWNAPMGEESCYATDTDFDLSKAVTDEDIAKLDIEDIKKLRDDGKISDECVAIVEDIDKVSEQLAILRDEGIAVLWRPLHEASNGYFWWGSDEDSYKWLWKLIYTRQTNYHKLNNLVWVWSAQNSDWYVGDKYCDVLSADVYSDSADKNSQVNSLLYLRNISKSKPIAMSECGSFPSVQNLADDKAMWSYIGQWGGNYLMTDEGKLSEEYNTAADLITVCNSNLTVTRDKLPDFTHLANTLKEEDEAEEDEAEISANEGIADSATDSAADGE
jgi:mannan endo-1,4-beta-mannosidase